MIPRNGDHQARGPVDIALLSLLLRPGLSRGRCDEAVAGFGLGIVFAEAQGYANNIWGVGLQNNRAAAAIQNHGRDLSRGAAGPCDNKEKQ